jgi:hypothetical protein
MFWNVNCTLVTGNNSVKHFQNLVFIVSGQVPFGLLDQKDITHTDRTYSQA